MERYFFYGLLISVMLLSNIEESFQHRWVTTDELENHINPEDLLEFMNIQPNTSYTREGINSNDPLNADSMETTTNLPVPDNVDCFGLGSLSRQLMSIFNMKPDSSSSVNTHFYFSSRDMATRVQVYPGTQFGLEWVDFKPNRKTVMIVHGFMSHSNASWVNDMARAFLSWGDVNVIVVDWSGGGNTWKYWRAVANTRRVGSDIVGFMRQLIAATGARTKDMHFVGHSLGAHIASYVSFHLGKVSRITGLDPAQPCFRTKDSTERLDATDADYVDIIHTNGRLLSRIGFGFPDRNGHADFYPNGGMKQPGCNNQSNSLWSKLNPFSTTSLQQAICSHGRAYLLFTESLINNNCTFRGHKWDLTYEGVNASLEAACNRVDSCSEMGIRAVGIDGVPRANGSYFVMTTDREPYCLENHINPEDLLEFMNMQPNTSDTREGTNSNDPLYADSMETTTNLPVPDNVDCFGFGPLSRPLMSIFNMKPDSSSSVNTHFYFSSRDMATRVQVYPGTQFGLEWVDFKPNRKTVMIVHGFMSHSNASWVNDMARAFLSWGDVNVIVVDWSGGGNTWKYWRAVANTRRVGSDIVGFMRQLIAATGARTKEMHFVGHSLGAHIASYVSFHLGKVSRITGLDPAQPCFRTIDSTERLDATDADYVDIIHTNGRLLSRIGFGLPDRNGHADFYPNGGMKQPGCNNQSNSLWSKLNPFSTTSLQQAICSHGRAYLLFTESLINNNCTFRGHKWDLTYEGVNASLKAACNRVDSCSEMGIRAVGIDGVPRANGSYFVMTTDREPYCPTEWERRHPQRELLIDLKKGFLIDRMKKATSRSRRKRRLLGTPPNKSSVYADPMGKSLVLAAITTTTQSSWFRRLFG